MHSVVSRSAATRRRRAASARRARAPARGSGSGAGAFMASAEGTQISTTAECARRFLERLLHRDPAEGPHEHVQRL